MTRQRVVLTVPAFISAVVDLDEGQDWDELEQDEQTTLIFNEVGKYVQVKCGTHWDPEDATVLEILTIDEHGTEIY